VNSSAFFTAVGFFSHAVIDDWTIFGMARARPALTCRVTSRWPVSRVLWKAYSGCYSYAMTTFT